MLNNKRFQTRKSYNILIVLSYNQPFSVSHNTQSKMYFHLSTKGLRFYILQFLIAVLLKRISSINLKYLLN